MKHRPPLPDDIKQLMALVRAGRLFDVQKWIAEGKRTVPPEPYWFSPLRVAIETGFHSMVELLLQAGIDQDEKDGLLVRSVGNSNFELIKLLVNYGADLKNVQFEDVCWTGNPEIMRYFLDHGGDAASDQPFARALCHPRRPHLGIYMRYRDRIPSFRYQLNLALRFHAREGSLKWVCLLLWAGGDAHVRLPDIGEEPDPESDTTALEEAVWYGRHEIVDKIGIDPARDDLNRLFERACSAGELPVMEKLLCFGADPVGAKSEYPPMERVISVFVWNACPTFGCRNESAMEDAFKAILFLADRGGRRQPNGDYHLNRFRRELYKLEPRWIEKVVRGFCQHQVCGAELLTRLLKTPQMKKILGADHPRLTEFIIFHCRPPISPRAEGGSGLLSIREHWGS